MAWRGLKGVSFPWASLPITWMTPVRLRRSKRYANLSASASFSSSVMFSIGLTPPWSFAPVTGLKAVSCWARRGDSKGIQKGSKRDPKGIQEEIQILPLALLHFLCQLFLLLERKYPFDQELLRHWPFPRVSGTLKLFGWLVSIGIVRETKSWLRESELFLLQRVNKRLEAAMLRGVFEEVIILISFALSVFPSSGLLVRSLNNGWNEFEQMKRERELRKGYKRTGRIFPLTNLLASLACSIMFVKTTMGAKVLSAMLRGLVRRVVGIFKKGFTYSWEEETSIWLSKRCKKLSRKSKSLDWKKFS